MHYETFKQRPENFQNVVEAAGCFCEWEDKLLFLLRIPEKVYGNTWGIPGGKFEKGETSQQAVIREVFEETGLDVSEGLESFGCLYVKLPHLNYIFHMFRKRFELCPEIRLGPEEHYEARWLTAEEVYQLPLIVGGKETLDEYLRLFG